MALKYLNGVQVGLEAPTSTGNYGWGLQHLKRLLFLWLKHVVGWTQVDVRGGASWGSLGNWDNPQSAQVTNGATDATNPAILTSATATWVTDSVAIPDLALVIGFTDPARNGFYQVQAVDAEGQLRIQTWNGVHTDGLPLNETGLSITIYRMHTTALLPSDDDAWILEGTGVGGAFHLRCVNDQSINYGGGWEFDISPWPDWLVGTHVWNNSPSRHTSLPNLGWNSATAIAQVWGVADLDFMFIVVRGFNVNLSANDEGLMYAGDIDRFHVASDPNPVVIALGKDAAFNEVADLQQYLRWIGGDNTTEVTGEILNPTYARDDSSHVLDGVFRTRSWHTDRFMRYPLSLACDTAGLEELRGQLKHLTRGHQYGPREYTPIGAARDQLRFGRVLIPWNGSLQLRNIV